MRRRRKTIDDMWDDYHSNPSHENMNALVEHYFPFVEKVASKTSSGLPPSVEVGDLASYGVFGLMRAIERYEPDKGYKFESFAAQRIRGSMIDQLRTLDWAPRSVRSKAKDIEAARERVERRKKAHATDEEIADELEISVKQVWEDAHATQNAGTVSLDVEVTTDLTEEVSTMSDVLPQYEDDMGDIHFGALRERTARAISLLPQREAVVFALYYHDQMMLSEVSVILGVTESRICQIHTRALERVEEYLLT